MRVRGFVSQWRWVTGFACAWAAFGCAEDTPMMSAAMGGAAGQSPTAMPGPAAAGSAPMGQAGMMATGAAGSAPVSSGGAGTGATAGRSGGTAGAATAAGTGAAGASGSAAGSGAAGTGGAAGGGEAGAAGGGAGGASGAGGTAGSMSEAGAGGTPAMHMDAGEGDGKDVVTIGDSWMNLILTGIEQSLDKASGKMYRHYAAPGTLVLNEQIPNQFKAAVAANPVIKTLIMTGGGNDILTSSCSGTACNPIVDDVAKRLMMMQTDMQKAGVEDLVIIGYTYPSDMSKHASLDHSREVSMQTCMPGMMPRCFFIDSSKLDITLQDGIHPNAAGYDLIGKTVYELMKKEGMRR